MPVGGVPLAVVTKGLFSPPPPLPALVCALELLGESIFGLLEAVGGVPLAASEGASCGPRLGVMLGLLAAADDLRVCALVLTPDMAVRRGGVGVA